MEARPDRFTALADANVLVPALCRNLLLSLAEAGLYRLRFSVPILKEVERTLPRVVAGMTAEKAALQVERIRTSFPEAVVEGFDHLTPMFAGGPDPDDAHVIAAAFKCDAAVIVTENGKDFPNDLLGPSSIEVLGADTFLADAIDLDQARACVAVKRMRERFKLPDMEPAALVDACGRNGFSLVAELLYGNLDSI